MQKTIKIILTATLIVLMVFSFSEHRYIYGLESEPEPSLSMPVEYVNYTVAWVNGSLWAKIDGHYPIYNSGFDLLPMAYPTPPGTTNISVRLDGVEIPWSNYIGIYPEDLHHTGIGDWPVIYAILSNVSDFFVLEIHYEHPIQVINSSYMFLYDLNIAPYLSPSANTSIAHFAVTMDVNFTDLNVQTVALDESLHPIYYTVTNGYPSTISVQMVSEYGRSSLGDLLFSFKTETNSEQVPWMDWLVVTAVAMLSTAAIIFLLYSRSKKAKQRQGLS